MTFKIIEEFAEKETFTVEKEIFMIGTHVDGRGNKRTFVEEDLDNIIDGFDKGVRSRNGVPLRLGHSPDQPLLAKAELPNAGIVTKLIKRGGKLIALIENVPKLIKEFIENKHFKTVSAGLLANFTDTVLKEKFALILDHVALLGQTAPAVKGLDEFKKFFAENAYLFSEKDGEMINIELNEDEINDLNKADDDSQKVAIPKAKEDHKKKEIDMTEERVKELEAQLKASESEKVELSDKLKTSETEKSDYAEKIETAKKDNEVKELEAKKVDVKNFLESEEVAKIILPYQREDYTEVLMKTDDLKSLEAKKAEILKYEEKIDLDEKGQANKKEDNMDSDIKEEKESMEERLKFSSGEQIEITHFDLHKKAEKAVKDGEFKTYQEAVIAFSK